MAHSATEAVEAGILAILEASEGLEEVTISFDEEPQRSSEFIWLWKDEDTEEFATLGEGPALNQQISFTLDVVAVTGQAGSSKENARAIREAMEDALYADGSLGGTALWCRVTKGEGHRISYDNKQGFRIQLTLTAKARIK
jgi:hypothetical protein